MQYDWSAYRKNRFRPSLKRRRTRYLLLLLVVLGASFLFNRAPVPETEASYPPARKASVEAPEEPPVPEIAIEVIEGAIQPGDTISSILGEYFTPAQIHNLARESRSIFPLSSICAGQPYKLCLMDGSFQSFEYDIDRDSQLVIRKEDDGIEIARVAIDYTVQQEVIRGTISSSLFDAVAEIGERPELAINLASIFAYDIDFIRHIRHGDSFQAVVEKRFREDQPAGYGRILAAEFANQGKVYRAFRFADGNRPPTYYDIKGNSRRTAFLRAPLSFTRISSGYTMRRFHPINKTWKAHPAIDYAAPTGTPIMTVGDGTVIKKGFTNGNGNYLRIRHSNGYETMYLHMSRFAKGMQQGKSVKQGEVIGYVGSTGLATGPHLCFRMLKNGDPINPNNIRSTTGVPVSKENMADFKATIQPLVALLEGREIYHARSEGESAPDSTTN